MCVWLSCLFYFVPLMSCSGAIFALTLIPNWETSCLLRTFYLEVEAPFSRGDGFYIKKNKKKKKKLVRCQPLLVILTCIKFYSCLNLNLNMSQWSHKICIHLNEVIVKFTESVILSGLPLIHRGFYCIKCLPQTS